MVPKGWEIRTLGDFVTEVVRRGGDGLPVLSVSKDLGIVLQTEKFGRILASNDRSRYKRIRRGEFAYDPMLLWDGSIARQTRVGEGVVSPAYYVFKLDTSTVDRSFVEHFLTAHRMKGFYRAISEGTNQRRRKARFEDFAALQFALPPLAEQRKIAAILSSVDDAIAATRQVIKQTKRVKQGLLQTLTTHGIGHTRFKETQIGEIPESWEVCSLGDVLDDIEAGRSPSAIDEPAEDGYWGVLKVSAIGDGVFFPEMNKTLPDGYSVEPRHRVKAGDVLISRANTADLVGATCRVPQAVFQLMLSDKTLRLKPNLKRITPGFLVNLANAPSSRRYFANRATGSSASMKNLSQAKIRSLPVALPPLAEQQSIESVVDGFQRALEAENAHTAGLEVLKAGLLQALLTGRVRVDPD